MAECKEAHREGYMAWHAKAQDFHAKGLTQAQCAVCGLWLWPDEAKQCSQFKPSHSQAAQE